MVRVWDMSKKDILEAAEKLEEIASEAFALFEGTYFDYNLYSLQDALDILADFSLNWK